MRKTAMFLLLFVVVETMRYNVTIDLRNFLLNMDQNAQFSLLTYSRPMQISCADIGNFPDELTFLNKIPSSYTPQQATFQTI